MCVAYKVAVVCLALMWLATMAQLWWVMSCAIHSSADRDSYSADNEEKEADNG